MSRPKPNYQIQFALLILLAFPAALFPASAVRFDAPRSYAAGGAPNSIAIGDFNGDGKPDLAVVIAGYPFAPGSGPTVSILLGTGGGTFGPPAAFPAGGQNAASITVADLNGDGKADVIVANVSSNISILFGNGDGTLQPPVSLSAGIQNTAFVRVGDFNGDGRPDLMASGQFAAISILLNNGDGTFQAPQVTSGGANAVVTGDFNRDGRLDVATLVVGPNNCTVYFYAGNGDGSLQSPLSIKVSKNCGGGDDYSGFLAYDFNQDRKLDLAVSGSGGTSILLGNGDGTFQIGDVYSAVGGFALAAADFNGDGIPDLAELGGELGIRLGNGDGTFAPARVLPCGGISYAFAVADLDADGHPDFAIASYDYLDVTVLLRPKKAVNYPMGGTPFGPAVAADFNGDGKPDLAAAITTAQNTGAVSIRLGHGDGTFSEPAAFPAGQGPGYMVAGDFNNDGKMDLAMANGGTNPITVSILTGNGDGTFQPPRAFTVGPGASSIAVADFNRDGNQDLAVLAYDSSLSLLLGNGDGTFQPQIVLNPNQYGWLTLAVADFNNDGNPDLAFTSDVSEPGGRRVTAIELLLGNGDGTFQPVQTTLVGGASGGYNLQLAAGDFNGDGNPDLAMTGAGVAMVLGNGDGSFQQPTFLLNTGFLAVTAVDLNHDGKQDLVLADDQLKILLGNGDGSFRVQRTAFITGSPPTLMGRVLYGIAVADFDGDGKPDLAFTNLQTPPRGVESQTDSGVAVLLNRTP